MNFSKPAFLGSLNVTFLEYTYPWVKWCYQYHANLQLGPLAFECSKDVQQGDSLGPLLFFLVLLDFMDSTDVLSGVSFQLW